MRVIDLRSAAVASLAAGPRWSPIALLRAASLLAWGGMAGAALAGRPVGWCGVGDRPGALASALDAGAAPSPLPWSPAAVAPGLCLMLVAMMAPLLAQPLTLLRQRSFAGRRGLATVLFLAGYAGVWLPCAAVLQLAGGWLGQRAAFPGLAVAVLLALAWQASPWKQRSLNACHRSPVLPAFGARADGAALGHGLTHARACVGACWASMLLPWVAGGWHWPLMVAVALLQFAERQERPATPGWRLRLPRRWARQLAFHAAAGG